MNGPSAQALREGGIGGSLRYKMGYALVIRIDTGGPLPGDWKKKTKLQSLFGDFGEILRIDVPEGQGVAYVEYDDKRDAEDAAREMNKKKVGSQTVTVEILGAQNQTARSLGGSGDMTARVTEMAMEHRLDEAATARLVSVFTERVRMGCDLNRDISELSSHLGASNKPSALVSMKLAELRSGQPIGPCKYHGSSGGRDRCPTGHERERGSRLFSLTSGTRGNDDSPGEFDHRGRTEDDDGRRRRRGEDGRGEERRRTEEREKKGSRADRKEKENHKENEGSKEKSRSRREKGKEDKRETARERSRSRPKPRDPRRSPDSSREKRSRERRKKPRDKRSASSSEERRSRERRKSGEKKPSAKLPKERKSREAVDAKAKQASSSSSSSKPREKKKNRQRKARKENDTSSASSDTSAGQQRKRKDA